MHNPFTRPTGRKAMHSSLETLNREVDIPVSPSSRQLQAVRVSQEKQETGIRRRKTPLIQSIKQQIRTDPPTLVSFSQTGSCLTT